jgi:hypothetical protein
VPVHCRSTLLRPGRESRRQYIGQVGQQVSIEVATVAARWCALNILAQAKSALGSLERIDRCLRVFGCVNATSPFPSVSPKPYLRFTETAVALVLGPDTSVGGFAETAVHEEQCKIAFRRWLSGRIASAAGRHSAAAKQ